VRLPEFLRGQVRFAGADFGVYRLFLVALVADHSPAASRSGRAHPLRRPRACRRRRPDRRARHGDRRRSRIQRDLRAGLRLAGLGGALGIEVLGLDPTFPLKYMVYSCSWSWWAGRGSFVGALVAAIVLGVLGRGGQVLRAQAGAFVIYAAMVVLLVAFPAGLFGRRR
jgi:branched-chain amino acid transport system permease protein